MAALRYLDKIAHKGGPYEKSDGSTVIMYSNSGSGVRGGQLRTERVGAFGDFGCVSHDR